MSWEAITRLFYTGDIPAALLPLIYGVAFVLGALHALSPGHGKGMMAAYLAGTGGRLRDVFVLGFSITTAHVSVVVIIGMLSLSFSDFFLSQHLTPYLGLASGLAIMGVGLRLFFERSRFLRQKARAGGEAHAHHVHPHSHPLAHGHRLVLTRAFARLRDVGRKEKPAVENPAAANFAKAGNMQDANHSGTDAQNPMPSGSTPTALSLWQDMALGFSSGIVPCPKAIVILLLAISVQRVALGLSIIAVFSLGLATTLIVLGIGVLKLSRRLLPEKRTAFWQWIPMAGAIVVLLLGVYLTVLFGSVLLRT